MQVGDAERRWGGTGLAFFAPGPANADPAGTMGGAADSSGDNGNPATPGPVEAVRTRQEEST